MKIWSNAEFQGEARALLEKGVGSHELVFSGSLGNNLSAGGFSPEMEGADIAFGQPDPAQSISSRSLKFVQITSAGYTRYDTDVFRRFVRDHRVRFCNSSSVYADPCAQHLLAFMLARARQIPAAVVEQTHGRGWNFDRFRPITKVLGGETVLILGYGAIGKRLIELLSPFQQKIFAFRRSPRGDEPVETYPITDLPSFLGSAEHVVNILPASDSTERVCDQGFFDRMKDGAIFYNIGRGTTVDQGALIASLQSGHLGAALLDVTDPEPLPTDHPLWSARNCTITPHIAGGFKGEQVVLVRHFLENLKRFETGEELIDQVY